MVNRVFIDANVLISTLVFPQGICGKALQKALEKGIELVTSDYVIFEVKEVLSRKFPKVPLDKLQEFLELTDITLLESPTLEEVLKYEDKISDKKDAPILATCIMHNITLVSGDKVFQTEKVKQLISVRSCSELLKQFENNNSYRNL
jgi:putative PIN family toxin of toxin-antitoxin system